MIGALRSTRVASPRTLLVALAAASLLFAIEARSADGAAVPPPQNGTCVETGGQVFQAEKLSDLPGGGERIRYRCGPIEITPGQNRIEWPTMLRGLHRPDRSGWITRLVPDLVRVDGSALRSDHVMFHHAVWLNRTRGDATGPSQLGGAFPERFFGAGEEKTTLDLPDGYGYRYEDTDIWTLNHMLHNLIDRSFELYIQYTLDFYPDGSEAAAGMTQVRPVWMDVDNGSFYPTFDVMKPTSRQAGMLGYKQKPYRTIDGGRHGTLTFPDDIIGDPYGSRGKLNEWTVDRDGYLVWTAGHVHSGGLWTDLNLIRQGASYEGPRCGPKAGRLGKLRRQVAAVNRKIKRLRASGASASRLNQLGRKRIRLIAAETRAEDSWKTCRESRPQVLGNKVRLFRSNARYFKRQGRTIGPISWDMGMFNSSDEWRPQLRQGDTLQVNTTYETKRGSWYESMGINFVFMADCDPEDQTCGENPYRVRQDARKVLNHGPYPENRFHGGEPVPDAPDPRRMSATETDGSLLIGDWTYESSDFRLGQVAAVRQGEQLTFNMAPGDVNEEIWHSLTSCKAPCNKKTGISYPIPDGQFRFDSGQLGTGNRGLTPTAGTTGELSWDTPVDMPTGTYTFFCRIHPDMRGAVKVLPDN